MTTARRLKLTRLLSKARNALEKEDGFLLAEAVAEDALPVALEMEEYDDLADVIEILHSARQQRVDALTAGGPDGVEISIIEVPSSEEEHDVQPGCYLVQPPQVGADARRLARRARECRVPIMVLCREPLTPRQLVPIVTLGFGTTIRAYVDPPKEPDKPDLQWFMDALDELGTTAMNMINPDMRDSRRIEHILSMVNALPDHNDLHLLAISSCREVGRTAESPS